MKHYGNISNIRGYDVPIVDLVTGGSPCQDLSVAGKRAGMKHEGSGHDETTRSGLFMEQIRIVKEMRENDRRTNERAGKHIRPRYMVWENVPGAFSSNKGKDFQAVLEETAKIADEGAIIPEPPKGKWRNSGSVMGDGWSIAWRVFDAQFWGVPQRRRRIYLVADFGGHTAPEILFERESVSGDIKESGTEREGTAGGVEGGIDKAIALRMREGKDGGGKGPLIQIEKNGTLGTGNDQTVFCLQGNGIDRADTAGCNGKGWREDVSYTLNTIDRPAVAFSFDSLASNSMKSSNPHSGCREVDTSKTLDTTNADPSKNQGGIAIVEPVLFEPRSQDGVPRIHDEICPTLNTAQGGQRQPCVAEPIALDRASYNQGKNAQYGIGIDETGTAFSMTAKGPGAVAYGIGNGQANQQAVMNHQTVRRLTPLECERLQGFPDNWTNISGIENPTEEQIAEWQKIFDDYNKAIGNDVKPKTANQVKKWLKNPVSDSAQYKALGNSVAIPNVTYVLYGIAEQLGFQGTIGSLFDGIGGFPLVWERLCGKESALWASEIEPFPILVTKNRFYGE